MYNRYIPQSDGTFQRNRIPDPQKEAPPCVPVPECPPPSPPPCPQEPTACSRCRQTSESATGFLRRLLPKNLDTGDLMIILLLLLMAGDCEENRNNALLTLAIYFFL